MEWGRQNRTDKIRKTAIEKSRLTDKIREKGKQSQNYGRKKAKEDEIIYKTEKLILSFANHSHNKRQNDRMTKRQKDEKNERMTDTRNDSKDSNEWKTKKWQNDN